MTRAVGYARISKDDTRQGRGVARQSDDIAAVCDRHGWDLTEIITDNDLSASRYSKKARTGYRRLVDMIAAGTVDRAVIYDIDRLSRQPRELEDLIDLCEQQSGFELHSINGHLDLATAAGRFAARIWVSKAAMEADDASRRIRRALEDKAARGEPHGQRAFGYRPGGADVDRDEAPLFVAAAHDLLAGVSLNSIARRWNALGITTPQRNRPWSGEVVKAVMTNPRHAGLRVHRSEVIGPGTWPALIDRETHERLVALLTSRRQKRPPNRTAFTGLIVGPNGVPLDRATVGGRPVYRGHRRPGREADQVSISAVPLERYVVESLLAAVDDGALAEVAGAQQARRQTSPDLTSIEQDLRGLAEDFGHGRISRAEWLAARRPLEARLAQAQATVPADGMPPLADLRGRWDGLDVDQQRTVLSAVFARVVVSPARSRGGPQPITPFGRIDLDRVELVWLQPA